MTTPFAHIAGLPLEETLPALLPAACALALAARATLAQASQQLRHQDLAGKDVTNNSLTGTDVRKKSLTPKDFTGSVRGQQGPPGPLDATGAKGDNGDPGPRQRRQGSKRAGRARFSTRSQPGGAQAHLQRGQGALELTSGTTSTTLS